MNALSRVDVRPPVKWLLWLRAYDQSLTSAASSSS